MKDELISKVMDEVMKKMGASDATSAPAAACCNNGSANCNLTEFVGTAIGHTIGLVIANVDHQIHEKMDIDPKYRSIGIIGDRTGAGPQIFAADEAVKATNCEIVKIELPRDTEGGAGHGSLIIFGAEDVSDARRAVEVCLREVERTMGDVYGSPAGHLEFQYTVGAPAAIGVLLADTAVKAATVDVVGYSSPANGGTSFSNEVILTFTGDSGAVKQAIIAARDVGMQVLKTLEPSVELKSTTTPYIL